MRPTRMRAFFRGFALTGFALTVLAFAQGSPSPQFEAASVRPQAPDDQTVTLSFGPGGKLTARGYPLKWLIQQAYEIPGFQIMDGPAWFEKDRWDVVAGGGPANSTRHQLNLMLQKVLEERFALKFHKIQKEGPGFELQVNGAQSKLKPSAATEENTVAKRDENRWSVWTGISMRAHAKTLQGYVSKPVVDNTGLTGLYDFKTFWNLNPDQMPDDQHPDGITLLTSLREQLGLKLVAKQVTGEYFVIDSAEKPTPE